MVLRRTLAALISGFILILSLSGQEAVAELTISKDFDLVFPHVIVQGADKTVVAGTSGAAQFTISGVAGSSVEVTVPASMDIITGIGGTDEVMTVTLTPAAGDTGVITLDAAGKFVVNVGGTVAAGATQAPGAYSGTFAITAVYL